MLKGLQMFYFDTVNNKKVLKSSMLSDFEPKLKHLFTTKESFIKTKEESLENTAKSNKDEILTHLKIENKNLFEINQTHSTNIIICPKNLAAIEKNSVKACDKNSGIFDNTDGVIIHKPNTATILHFADCTPVLLYDPENNIAAGLHAGWRGTAGKIASKGVQLMEKNFGSNPEKIVAAIGPCIGQEDFESGIEVYEALKTTVSNTNALFKFKENPSKPFTDTPNPKCTKVFPDLAKINESQLLEAGVKTIDICHFKTNKDNEFLFSYRRENKTTNRISMILKLD